MGRLSKVLVLFITSALCWCFSINIAHAEEVEITPSTIAYLTVHSDQSGFTSPITLERYYNVSNSYPWNLTNCILGDYGLLGGSRYVSRVNPSQNYGGIGLDRLGYSYTGYSMPDLNVTIDSFVVELKVDDLPSGYYRLEQYFCFGLCGTLDPLQYTTGSYSFEPSYVTSDNDFWFTTNEGYDIHASKLIDLTYSVQQGNGAYSIFSLCKFHYETTFYHDATTDGEYIAFVFTDSLLNLGKSFYYDFSMIRALNRSQTVTLFANNRLKSILYANVEPPITPTPSPTPYPGQDTQESINVGVQQIVSDLSVYATPVPTPGEISLDPTTFDYLEDLTLPDVSEGSRDISNMWLIFTPAVGYLTLLATSIFVVSIFIYIIRGGWL